MGEPSAPPRQHSRRLTDQLIAAIPNGVIVTAEDGRVLLMNPAAHEMIPVVPEPIGKVPYEAIVVPEIARALELGNIDDEFEVVTNHHHISVRIFELDKGRMAILQDVTRFHLADTAKADFVANVSHELRTPATAIAGYAETLLAEADSMDPAHVQMVETIYRNGQRLTALFDDLLLLAKLDAGPSELPLEPLSVSHMVDDVMDRVHSKADARGISVQKVMADEDLMVMANRDALRHVVGNLVENGIKYSFENGVVTIRVRKYDEVRILIEVIDVGMGIDTAHHDRIFERFYRVDKGRSRAEGGTGLGLSIVKRMVLAMSGEIELRSRRGRGSVFRLFLAAADGY